MPEFKAALEVSQRQVPAVDYLDRWNAVPVLAEDPHCFGYGEQVLVLVSKPWHSGPDVVDPGVGRIFLTLVVSSHGIYAKFAETMPGRRLPSVSQYTVAA